MADPTNGAEAEEELVDYEEEEAEAVTDVRSHTVIGHSQHETKIMDVLFSS
jgi:hypothetical protein